MATIFGSGYTSISFLTGQCDNQIQMAVGALKTMQNGILKRASLDFQWFLYDLRGQRQIVHSGLAEPKFRE